MGRRLQIRDFMKLRIALKTQQNSASISCIAPEQIHPSGVYSHEVSMDLVGGSINKRKLAAKWQDGRSSLQRNLGGWPLNFIGGSNACCCASRVRPDIIFSLDPEKIVALATTYKVPSRDERMAITDRKVGHPRPPKTHPSSILETMQAPTYLNQLSELPAQSFHG